ncbi:MAG: PilT/PilU family type 4a pilus ATPase, partial [Myxococcota bacterium]
QPAAAPTGNTNVGPAPARTATGTTSVGPAPKRGGGLELLPRLEAAPEPPPPPPPVAAESLDLMLEPVDAAPEPPSKQEVSELFALMQNQADPKEEMELYLRVASEMGVSDLHLHADCSLYVRTNAELTEQKTDRLDAARLEALVRAILTDEQKRVLDEKGEVDFAYTLPGVARYRANAYKQQRGLDAVFRYIPPEPPSLTDLGLQNQLAPALGYRNGLVLFTGPSGCGKSTTLAAVVRHINEKRTDHIITIEDPIEFVHKPRLCAINQRQVGAHTESYPRALRGALREDPDVIVVGELRDFESISLAMSAAETGHLVLGTLTTANATGTVNRLINAYPSAQQNQARGMLSESLRAVISQRLCTNADGKKRVVAAEVLLVNKAVSNMIRENKTTQIRTILQTSASEGMCLLDNALAVLVQSGTITKAEAARYAEEPKRFAG